MTNPPSDRPIAFDADHAARYDEQFACLQPLKDSLHLFTHLALLEVADDARVLVVGAGTAQEILALAPLRPGWRFTALDPSGPMLAVARDKLAAAGLEDRCRFVEGTLADLPVDAAYDVATSILVSHFCVDPDERRAFFAQIRARLAPGGHLVCADLAATGREDEDARMFALWRRTFHYAGVPEERLSAFLESYGRDVSVAPAPQVERLLDEAGFSAPTWFFQIGFIRAVHARAR